MELIFLLSFLLVGPAWLLMIALPGWSWTRRIAQSPWIVAPVALLYLLLFLIDLPAVLASATRPTLASIAAYLGTPAGATLNWLHLSAIDLLAGRWIYLDSRGRAISAWLLAPILFVCWMFAPIGLLIYLGVRWYTALGARK